MREHLRGTEGQFNHAQMVQTFLDLDRFRRWHRVLRRHADMDGARFLSSGCGMGGSLMVAHESGATTAVGVEVEEQEVRLASLRVAELDGVSVRAIHPTAPLPFDDGAFDAIESMDVIEHVVDPQAYLSDLVRVLAVDGRILLSTPNRLWPVEQHLGILGPPWLPVRVADALFGLLARLPLSQDRRFRYRRLRGMRTQNMGLRRLQRLATSCGLHLSLVLEDAMEEQVFPTEPMWVRRLLRHRLGKFVAPARHLVVVLRRSGDRQ